VALNLTELYCTNH